MLSILFSKTSYEQNFQDFFARQNIEKIRNLQGFLRVWYRGGLMRS